MDELNAEKSLLARVRNETWSCHEQLEKLPFVEALTHGTLPLESYLGQLRGLAVVMGTLGQLLAGLEGIVPQTLRGFLRERFDQVCEDLGFFAPRLVPDLVPAVRCALEIAAELRSLAANSPDTLAACLYVFEGTIKGNEVHLPDLKRCFQLDGDQGCRFYSGYRSDTDQHWQEFSRLFDAVAAELEPERVIGAVRRLYAELTRLHALLYPIEEGALGLTATSLNPEAGDHPVPEDPEVLQAALRAGQRCWDEFSYYGRRYGGRGRRFTDSDVAWLAALASLPEEVVIEQVQWLGRLLAARGMPRYLLERQLALLDEELSRLTPPPRRDGLQGALARLAFERQSHLDGAAWSGMAARLGQLFPQLVRDFPDLPVVLVAAFVDRSCGLPECLVSLLDWLKRSSLLEEKDLQRIRDAF